MRWWIPVVVMLAAGWQVGSPARAREAAAPRWTISLSGHYMQVDGWAYAREQATERTYTSADMQPLNVPEEMGVRSMWVFAVKADGRLSRRNHLAVNYYYGADEGRGEIDRSTGFNDHDFPGPDLTDGKVTMEALQFLWYYRALDLPTGRGPYRLDLGLGVESLRSYESFATEANEQDFDTEAVYAPFVVFGHLRSEWEPRAGLTLGTEAQLSFWSWQDRALDDLPAKGYFNRADIYARAPLGKYFDLAAGAAFWNFEVDFDGVEINHRDHLADNEVELWLMGPYLEMTLHPSSPAR